MNAAQGEVTRLLQQLKQGDPDAEQRLIPLVYNELRRIASINLRHERAGHSFQATALVHEAYLKLTDLKEIDWPISDVDPMVRAHRQPQFHALSGHRSAQRQKDDPSAS
ncbi:ECF-type sigma factor [Acidicapsa dinghuensis]|uniref:ECF-type sigma factor n=1 Tax=Acidicapsa dinghuensis TaxID=2218256 RepID=A0ABW1ENX0_9BACT|nr:ECF-type sigma factor [Acidicapsa dinghuensis]